MLGLKVKKGDQVEILSGKDRGKRGRVVRVWPKNAKVLVEGVNFVKRHEKVRGRTPRSSRDATPRAGRSRKHLRQSPLPRTEDTRVCRRCGGSL